MGIFHPNMYSSKNGRLFHSDEEDLVYECFDSVHYMDHSKGKLVATDLKVTHYRRVNHLH